MHSNWQGSGKMRRRDNLNVTKTYRARYHRQMTELGLNELALHGSILGVDGCSGLLNSPSPVLIIHSCQAFPISPITFHAQSMNIVKTDRAAWAGTVAKVLNASQEDPANTASRVRSREEILTTSWGSRRCRSRYEGRTVAQPRRGT